MPYKSSTISVGRNEQLFLHLKIIHLKNKKQYKSDVAHILYTMANLLLSGREVRKSEKSEPTIFMESSITLTPPSRATLEQT